MTTTLSPTASFAACCSPTTSSPQTGLSASQDAVGSLSGESFATSRAAEMVAHVTESLAKVLPRDVAEERARNVVSGMLLYLWDAFDVGHAQGVADAASELPPLHDIGGSE